MADLTCVGMSHCSPEIDLLAAPARSVPKIISPYIPSSLSVKGSMVYVFERWSQNESGRFGIGKRPGLVMGMRGEDFYLSSIDRSRKLCRTPSSISGVSIVAWARLIPMSW